MSKPNPLDAGRADGEDDPGGGQARRADDRHVAALGIGLRAVAAEASGDAVTAEAEAARLAVIRDDLAAEEQRRIEAAAQKLTGLVPAAEIAPGEDTAWLEPEPDVTPEPDPAPAPRRVTPTPPPRPAAPREPEIRTNYRTDKPDTRDPLLKPF